MRNNRLLTVQESLNKVNEAQTAEDLEQYGYYPEDIRALMKETKVKGLWSQGGTLIYPVFAMKGRDGWYKSMGSKDNLQGFTSWVLGTPDKKILDREIIGIFFSEEDAKKVYDAIQLPEDK